MDGSLSILLYSILFYSIYIIINSLWYSTILQYHYYNERMTVWKNKSHPSCVVIKHKMTSGIGIFYLVRPGWTDRALSFQPTAVYAVGWLIVERNLSSLIFLAEGCRRWRRICNVLRSSSHLCTAVVVHSRRGVIGMIDWCQMHRSALWPKNLSLDSHTLCVAPLQCRYMCWNQCFTNCWQARYDLFSTLSRPTTIR